MSSDRYEKLTQMDNTFLVFEDSSAHMHVGSTLVFEGGALRTAEGGIDAEKARRYVLSRLHRIPRYRQRLAVTPLSRRPVWVDDDRFNLFYHVRHTRLPPPGDERILKRVAGRIMSQPLDLHKPLWEMWLIEGLEDGRFAIVTKVHHCMIDGIAGVDLLSALLGLEPNEEVAPPHAWAPRPAPSTLELLGDELLERMRIPFTAAGALGRLARNEDGARERLGERFGAVARMIGRLSGNASTTPFNQPIGPYWRFDWLATELAEIRAVKARLGGTVNDIVLATVAGAVRRYLTEERGMNLDGLDFRVMAPVSMRSDQQRGALGNQVSSWIVTLPIQERDPVERVRRITEQTREFKSSKLNLGTETITLASEWMGSGLLSLGARLVRWSRPFNLVVTNVPGPPVPLYLLGSRLIHAYPMLPLFGNLSTGIALFSYADSLYWGIMADWETVPDVHEFTLAIEASFAELKTAAEVTPAEPPPPARERKKVVRPARLRGSGGRAHQRRARSMHPG